MKSIFIPLMAVVVFANRKLDQLAEKSNDGIANIMIDIDDDNCATAIADQMDLLCDAFTLCQDQGMYGTPECVNKDQVRAALQNDCGKYDTYKFELDIHPNKNTYDDSEVSLTFTYNTTTIDDPCTVTITEEQVFNFNDNGLITKLSVREIGDASRECPQSNEYESKSQGEYIGEKPLATAAKHKNIHDYVVEFYRLSEEILESNTGDCQARINAMGYLLDSSCQFCVTENGEPDACTDLGQWKASAEEDCGKFADIEYTLNPMYGDSYSPSLSYRVDYEIQQHDGCTIKLSTLETFEFNDQELITLNTIETIVKPTKICPKPIEYGEQNDILPPVAISDSASTTVNKAVSISVLDNDYDPANQHELMIEDFTSGKKGSVEIDGDKLIYTPYFDECGSDKFIYYIGFTDNKELTDSANVHINIPCPHVPDGMDAPPMPEIDTPVTDYNNQYIPSEPVYGAPIIDTPPPPATYDGLAQTMRESRAETSRMGTYYDNDQQKKDAVYKMNNKFGHVMRKKDGDKMCDEDMKEMFCDNMEYETVCDEDTKDCGAFKTKIFGRKEFLKFYKQYENMFDEVMLNNGDINMWHIEYRKGQCQGEYRERIQIEYDSINGCISKFTEYMGDVTLTDQDCDNSAYKLWEKLENECTFDPEPDTSNYEPATGYSSGLDSFVQQELEEEDASSYTSRLVRKEREDKLKSFYDAAFECRLKKNAGNTETLDIFLGYFGDSSKLCVTKDDHDKCYNKNELRQMMGDRYADDNIYIDHHVDIMYNDGNTIRAKCTSQRRKSNGCVVIKEEYDECLFNSDGTIKQFTVTRSNHPRTECYHDNDNNGNNYEQDN